MIYNFSERQMQDRMAEQENKIVRDTQGEQDTDQQQSGLGGRFGDQGDPDLQTNLAPRERYSNLGPHGPYGDPSTADDEDPLADTPDTGHEQYGEQDQFGDVDNEDPFSNLYDDDPGSTPGGDGLYAIEDPLAQPASPDKQESNRTSYGTKTSQDQQGDQQ